MKHNISLIFLTSLIFFGARGASSDSSFEKEKTGGFSPIKRNLLTGECFYNGLPVVVKLEEESPWLEGWERQDYMRNIPLREVHIDRSGNRFSCFGSARLGEIAHSAFTPLDGREQTASLFTRVDSSNNPISSVFYLWPLLRFTPVRSTLGKNPIPVNSTRVGLKPVKDPIPYPEAYVISPEQEAVRSH